MNNRVANGIRHATVKKSTRTMENSTKSHLEIGIPAEEEEERRQMRKKRTTNSKREHRGIRECKVRKRAVERVNGRKCRRLGRARMRTIERVED